MWQRSSTSERRDPEGRGTRVGYLLRRNGYEQHCGIVSRIALAADGRRTDHTTLITGSRDGTLKCWDVAQPEDGQLHSGGAVSSTAHPRLRCSLEEHTGWVNDAIVLPSQGSADASRDCWRVVSASNDNMMKIWYVDEAKRSAKVLGALMTLRYHVDYVQCMTYSPHRTLLVSAGLDARVVVADLEAASSVLQFPNVNELDEPSYTSGGRGVQGHRGLNRCSIGSFSGNGQYVPHLLATPLVQTNGGRGDYDRGRGGWSEEPTGNAASLGASVWSLSITRNASLLACGTASSVVRGWDPRAGVRVWRFKGHTENVRAVVLSEDGTLCVSGSADHTVRVWDVGMRRCVHVFDAHDDSVWALAVGGMSCGYSPQDGAAGGQLREVYSGGRDGLVIHNDLRLLQTSLVCRESSAVQSLAVSTGGSELWTGTADSNVSRHVVTSPHLLQYPMSSPESVPPPGSTAHSPVKFPSGSGQEQVVIHGIPRLVDFRVLHNKRQVLTRDVCNRFSLWDVTTGQCMDVPTPPVASHNGSGLNVEEATKKVLDQVNKPVSIPSWFSCDVSLGSLLVYLDASQCFRAEVEDADLAVLPSGAWPGSVRSVDTASTALVNLGLRVLRSLFETWVSSGGWQGRAHGGVPYTFTALQSQHEGTNGNTNVLAPLQPLGTPTETTTRNEVHTAVPTSSGPSAFSTSTVLVLVTRHGRSSGYRGRLFCGLFSGVESPELLPPWVVDAVWHQRPPPEDLCGEKHLPFCLVRSSTEEVLPALPSPYCVAPPRTRVKRLISYLVRVLEFDWSAPTRIVSRRSRGTGSLVTRLGRCCAVPSGKSRSSEQLNSDSDGSVRGRQAGGTFGTCMGSSPGRSYEEISGAAPPNLALRVRVDGSPAPLPNVPAAQTMGSKRKSGSPPLNSSGSSTPVHNVEILCNDALVDPEMSLATVRDFLWRRPNTEMVLTYRRIQRPSILSPAPIMQGAASPNGASPTEASTAVNSSDIATATSGKGHE